ncbi:MAG TPA: hypothetical protein VK186_28285 [Candidatus Deferrimicrobium sp.]|nr:hypothetical protein [Candidatus Kapabacteria bacterium]HLP62770.1 hypothetical protein [Candidatus Deferrimicrobium sp.]
MAEQANVFVKNLFTDAITVFRKLPDGNNDLEKRIPHGNEEEIILPGPTVAMIIHAPNGVDTQNSPIVVRSSIIDLAVKCSRTDGNWTIKIIPNDLPPEVPTTVNITVGADGP